MSTLLMHSRRRFVNALVTGAKLSYSEERGHPPTLKGNKIIMPTPKLTPSRYEEVVWMEALVTLCYSALPENAPDVALIASGKVKMDDNMGFIFNTVAKYNHQLDRDGFLFGADEYIRESIQYFYRTMDVAECSDEAQALLAFDLLARQGWCVNTDYGVVDKLSSLAQDKLDRLVLECPEYKHGVDAGQDRLELSKKIYEILFEEEYDESQNEQEQQSSGDGEGDEQGDQQGKQEGSEGEAEGDAGAEGKTEEGEERTQAAKAKQERFMGEGIKASQIGKDQSGIACPTGDRNDMMLPVRWSKPEPCGDEGHRVNEIMKHSHNKLSTKVRNLLKVMSQAQYKGGKKRGKINKKAIATVTTGNDRLFRTKEQKDILDTTVLVLLDCSGSMSGKKYTHGVASCVMLSDCLQKLHIPVAVHGFTSGYEDLAGGGYHDVAKNFIFKDFNQGIDSEDMISRMLNVSLCGNADAESLLASYDVLARQKQKRKVLIVLSDGEPADGHNPWDNLKKVASSIEASKHCELYSIGIQTRAVERFYKNNTVINSPEELEEKLLSVIKNTLIG